MLLDQTLSILHLNICQTIHFRDKENKSTRERERKRERERERERESERERDYFFNDCFRKMAVYMVNGCVTGVFFIVKQKCTCTLNN